MLGFLPDLVLAMSLGNGSSSPVIGVAWWPMLGLVMPR
jgi:hypothetical protein